MTDAADRDFDEALRQFAGEMDHVLRRSLDGRVRDAEIARPARLLDAMRHGVLNGGKRLRPFLVVEAAAMLGGGRDAALTVGAALEYVHCYSLIHDDLPAMDDDDLRRGQPTVHRAFDEATAILAGDALLTLGFDLLCSAELPLPAPAKVALAGGLARAAGLGGMVGGQMLDLEAETDAPAEEGIVRLQAMKTGALFRFACEAGAVVAGASEVDRERLAAFGSAIGLAFQLADDLLDVTASSAIVGKATGKDVAAGKATLVALHGADWARRQLAGLVAQADELMEPYGNGADTLRQAARFVATRSS
jgi:farnesyl diphosphate synthase